MNDRSPQPDDVVGEWLPRSDFSLLRSVAAVILGFVVLTAGAVGSGRLLIWAVGVDSGDALAPGFIAANAGSRLLVAIVAGYMTAAAAPRAPRTHAGMLALVLVFFGVAALGGLVASGQPTDPAWYPVAILVVGSAGVVAGGALRARRRAVRQPRA